MKKAESQKPPVIDLFDAPPVKQLVRQNETGDIEFLASLANGKEFWHYQTEAHKVGTRRGLIRLILQLSVHSQWATIKHAGQLIELSHKLASRDPHTGEKV